jgi:hypothetical protein
MDQRAEQIKDAARKIAGCDITIRVGEVEPMLVAGWDAILVGSVVYANTIRVDDASKIYIKASATEITGKIKSPAGGWIEKTAAMPNDVVKNQMLDSYITRTIIGARKG